MMITTIALRRYQLRHAKLPRDLTELVPDYLKTVPRDPVEGQPLRYQSKSDGTFILYSIGKNATDDGGDPRPAELPSTWPRVDWGSGRD